MIELFSDVTFTTEFPSGGVAPPNEMDVTVFSDVPALPELSVLSDVPVLLADVSLVDTELGSVSASNGLVPAPPPQDATNIAIQIDPRILRITALPFFGTKKTLQCRTINKDIIIYISIR